MSRPAELNGSAGQLEDAALEARGFQRCEHCGKTYPLTVSRCRRRTCPGYAVTWARDAMRKNRENLRTYGGLAAMCTLTPPGVDAGLIWDRSQCGHEADERCGQRFGCKVVPEVAALWNKGSRGWWSELNRVCKQRADRAVKRLGHDGKGGVLLYQWELQKRGLWHLHFVVGLETAVERVWAYEYVAAMRELAPRYGFGFVDGKPLRRPERAERVAGYLSKYLAKWKEDGSCEVTETVLAAGRSYLNYVSRKLTAKSGCTMRVLRNVRIAWAWRAGHLPDDAINPFDLLTGLLLLEQFDLQRRSRAP
jgi:hypothetical protein